MDISALPLPLRKDREQKSLFSVRPSLTSVNVSYETAAGNIKYEEDAADNDDSEDKPIVIHLREPASAEVSGAGAKERTQSADTTANASTEIHTEHRSHAALRDNSGGTPRDSPQSSPRRSYVLSSPPRSRSHASLHMTGSPTGSTHEFPAKEQSQDKDDDGARSASTPKHGVTNRQRRARSSFSVASVECQSFVSSLKEPKYAKPLTSDEIAWIFQDFYLKLRSEILGSSDELLTREEQEQRKQAESDIEMVLDKAERAVTGGELYSKLFALGGSHDSLLQPRIDAIREKKELLSTLTSKLEINEDHINEEEFASAVHYLNRLSKETSPKAKLQVLTKAHHAIAEALPKNSGDADTIFPLFVLALTKSTATDWWQNFLFIQRFRRASELVGQAAYCLTNLEAAIHVLEQFTLDSVPDGVDPAVFAKPIVNPRSPRERSSSQSSKGSSSNSSSGATASFSQRLGDTLSSYRSMFAASTLRRPQIQPHQVVIEQKFLTADADSLTLGDVKTLLREYKRLAEFVEMHRALSFTTVQDGKGS